MKKNDYCVEILNIWESTFEDTRCNAIIYYKSRAIANIVECFDKNNVTKPILEKLILENIEKYRKLPKISECHKLLKEAYDTVCQSENEMFYMTDDDWKEFVKDGEYDSNDFKIFQEEVKKHKLEEVVSIDSDGEKIIGYGNLSTMFNDDRELEKLNKSMNSKETNTHFKNEKLER